jgi:DNA-binding NarL/FixJ family response regulator
MGRWSAAREDAERVLSEEGMPVAALWPHLVASLVPLRRGEEVDADALERAWALAAAIDEPARRLAVLTALAERQWLTGIEDPRVTEAVTRLLAEGGSAGVAWTAGDLCVWASRLPQGLDAAAVTSLLSSSGWLPEPHRLVLSGQAGAAARWWSQAGDPYAAALAWGDSAETADRVRGVDLLDRMGAKASADRRRAELRRDGITAVPPRPRQSTRANPGGLTNRQLEVAKLVARGFTNAEIADRLFITPKTADHHVSAVLARLGLPHRRAVVVRAEELGLA